MRYDYHNHLKYCNHADLEALDTAKEYVKRGFVELGYSDHIPYPAPWDAVDNNGKSRMKLAELPNYLADIDAAIALYGDRLKIYKGLEAEYFRTQIAWFKTLLFQKGIDYLILGVHAVEDLAQVKNNYNKNCTTKTELKKYWKAFAAGMKTELYLYAVHPDFYMKSYPKWDRYCVRLATKICKMAAKYNFALGFNINGFWKGPRQIGTTYRNKYPVKAFWMIAKKYRVKIILESDVHHKAQLYDQEVIPNVYQLLKKWAIDDLLITSLNIPAYRKKLTARYLTQSKKPRNKLK